MSDYDYPGRNPLFNPVLPTEEFEYLKNIVRQAADRGRFRQLAGIDDGYVPKPPTQYRPGPTGPIPYADPEAEEAYRKSEDINQFYNDVVQRYGSMENLVQMPAEQVQGQAAMDRARYYDLTEARTPQGFVTKPASRRTYEQVPEGTVLQTEAPLATSMLGDPNLEAARRGSAPAMGGDPNTYNTDPSLGERFFGAASNASALVSEGPSRALVGNEVIDSAPDQSGQVLHPAPEGLMEHAAEWAGMAVPEVAIEAALIATLGPAFLGSTLLQRAGAEAARSGVSGSIVGAAQNPENSIAGALVYGPMAAVLGGTFQLGFDAVAPVIKRELAGLLGRVPHNAEVATEVLALSQARKQRASNFLYNQVDTVLGVDEAAQSGAGRTFYGTLDTPSKRGVPVYITDDPGVKAQAVINPKSGEALSFVYNREFMEGLPDELQQLVKNHEIAHFIDGAGALDNHKPFLQELRDKGFSTRGRTDSPFADESLGFDNYGYTTSAFGDNSTLTPNQVRSFDEMVADIVALGTTFEGRQFLMTASGDYGLQEGMRRFLMEMDLYGMAPSQARQMQPTPNVGDDVLGGPPPGRTLGVDDFDPENDSLAKVVMRHGGIRADEVANLSENQFVKGAGRKYLGQESAMETERLMQALREEGFDVPDNPQDFVSQVLEDAAAIETTGRGKYWSKAQQANQVLPPEAPDQVPTSAEVPGRIGSLRTDKIGGAAVDSIENLPAQEVREQVSTVAGEVAEPQRIPDDALQRMADDVDMRQLLDTDLNDAALTAPQMEQSRRMVAASAYGLRQAAKKYNANPTPENWDNVVKWLTANVESANLASRASSEAGRTLRTLRKEVAATVDDVEKMAKALESPVKPPKKAGKGKAPKPKKDAVAPTQSQSAPTSTEPVGPVPGKQQTLPSAEKYNTQQIREFLDNISTDPVTQKRMIEMINDMPPSGIAKAIDLASSVPAWHEVVHEIRLAAMLWNPFSHARNIVGNITYGGIKSAEYLLQYPTSTPAYVVGALKGLLDGVVHFGRSMKAGRSSFASEIGEELSDKFARDILHSSAVERLINIKLRSKGKAGKAAEYGLKFHQGSLRGLSAEDDWFKSMAYRAVQHAEAYRAAKQQGISMEQAMELPEVKQAALTAAKDYTFTNETSAASKLSRYLQGMPYAGGFVKVIAPFITIGMNLTSEGMQRLPPVASYRLSKALVEGQTALAKRYGAEFVTGTTIMGIALASTMHAINNVLSEAPVVTGGKPMPGSAQQSSRQEMRLGGWQGYSVKIGDRYRDYRQALGPAGFLSMLGSDAAIAIMESASEYPAVREQAGNTLVKSAHRALEDFSLYGDMATYFDALPGQESETLQREIGNVTSSFIPFSGLLRGVARTGDPYVRDSREGLDTFGAQVGREAMQSIPGEGLGLGGRESMAPRRDQLGQPLISSPGQAFAEGDYVETALSNFAPSSKIKPELGYTAKMEAISNIKTATSDNALDNLPFEEREKVLTKAFKDLMDLGVIGAQNEAARKAIREDVNQEGYYEKYGDDAISMGYMRTVAGDQNAVQQVLRNMHKNYVVQQKFSQADAVKQLARAAGFNFAAFRKSNEELFVELAREELERDRLRPEYLQRYQHEN